MTEEMKMNETNGAAGEPNVQAADELTSGEASAAADNDTDLTNIMTIKKGSVVKGKIVKVEADQAIVDVGYKYDGVIPIRELSSVQLDDANAAVEVGQEVELKVVTLDDEKERLVLSKRAIDSENAWEDLQAKLESGEIIEAKVADVVKGGLVVDVGARGFVPASMVERHFVEDFSDYKGRTLRLRVKELDREKNKVILSQKDVLDEQFESNKREILGGIQVGQVLEGTVQRLTQFGAFVDIGGIDGLVHVSEMAWHHVEKPSDVVKEGDRVKVQVLKVDPANERISLSIKATEPGPWEKLEGIEIGSVITGTVKRLVSFGAFVEVAPGVEGLVHISQISHQHIGTPHEVLREGQEVQVKVLDVNPGEKRISLSIKETEDAPAPSARQERGDHGGRGERRGGDRRGGHREDKASTEYMEKNNQGLNLTLGERFGDKLSKFK